MCVFFIFFPSRIFIKEEKKLCVLCRIIHFINFHIELFLTVHYVHENMQESEITQESVYVRTHARPEGNVITQRESRRWNSLLLRLRPDLRYNESDLNNLVHRVFGNGPVTALMSIECSAFCFSKA